MLLLSVDTSGRNGSLALLRGDAESCSVLELAPLEGGQYSAQLLPTLIAALARQQLTKRDIDAFVVASGPGSFTGLRVGLATVKGLAEIFDKPIAAISVLEAIAATSNQPGRVIAALDAGRREVYCGDYSLESGRTHLLGESLVPYAEFRKHVEGNSSAQLITPDAAIAELATFHTQVKQIDRPQADSIGRLGLARILAGETVSPAVLEANYIRRSDAEIFAKPPAQPNAQPKP